MKRAMKAGLIAGIGALVLLVVVVLGSWGARNAEGAYVILLFLALVVGFPTSWVFYQLNLMLPESIAWSPALAMLVAWPVNWFLLTLVFDRLRYKGDGTG